jgi:hypothetical protein
LSPGFPSQPASINIRQVAGVACITVAPELASRAPRRMPSAAVSRLASSTRPPTASGRNSSSTAMSNDRVVTATRVSAEDSPGWRAMLARKLAAARWGTPTPFGRPVEPEV